MICGKHSAALAAVALGTTPIPSSPRLLVNPEASDSCAVTGTFFGGNRGHVTLTQYAFEIALDSHNELFVLRPY